MDNIEIKHFFDTINKECSYLVLRNWNELFTGNIYEYSHNDIDILCENRDEFVKITHAIRIHQESNRDNYVVSLETFKIRLDIRWVGDGYYPLEWQKNMLKRRVYLNGIYVMSEDDYKYSLLYHAFLQKMSVSEDYKNKIKMLFSEEVIDDVFNVHYTRLLKEYLQANNYHFELPLDPGVFVNWRIVNMIPRSISYNHLVKRQLFILRRRFVAVFRRFFN